MILETNSLISRTGVCLGRELIFQQENKVGERNIVITVNDGQKDLIIKAGLDVETDFIALKLLNKLDIAAPRLEYFLRLGEDFGNCNLIIMAKLRGVMARSLPQPERAMIVSQIIDELEKLRLIGSDVAGPLNLVERDLGTSWKKYLELILEESINELSSVANATSLRVNNDLISEAQKFVRAKLSMFPDGISLSLLHNDINLANCLVSDGKLEGIVDWSDAVYGDYLFDLSRLRILLSLKTVLVSRSTNTKLEKVTMKESERACTILFG